MSLDDILNQLRQDYLKAMPDKIKGLHQLLGAKEFEKLQTEFHKLKGTGRTYGIPEVSTLGELIETIFQTDPALREAVTPVGAGLLQKIHDTRSQGQVFTIEDDPEYKKLVETLEKATSRR